MKKFIILFILFTAVRVNSQIILSSNNNPSPGDSKLDIECDTTGITAGNSGANQVWNFTGIVRQDSTLLTWLSAGSTPYAAQFPSSNVALTTDNAFYDYETTSSSNLIFNGIAGPSYLETYSDPQTYIQYPFTFGSSHSDNFASNYTISGVNGMKNGNIFASGDAWGTINLPAGSFNNATRVKHIITTRDSSILFVINTTITTYSWYVPGKKFPIFEIGFISSVQGGANTLFKTVSYTPSGPSVGISNVNTTYPDKFTLQQNYPNPFNPATSINYIIHTPGFVMLKVYDAAGKEIEILVNKKQTAGSYDIRWSGEKFNSGIYFYKLESNGNSETKKMILLK